MKARRVIWVGLMVLPFLALGTQADSLDPLDAGATNALPSQTQSDSLDSSATLGTTTVFEESPFADRTAFGFTNFGCRRIPFQGGSSPIGCGNGAGGFAFPVFGGRPIIVPLPWDETTVPDPPTPTTTVPDPSTFLLVATGLLGGVVRLRRLMR